MHVSLYNLYLQRIILIRNCCRYFSLLRNAFITFVGDSGLKLSVIKKYKFNCLLVVCATTLINIK